MKVLVRVKSGAEFSRVAQQCVRDGYTHFVFNDKLFAVEVTTRQENDLGVRYLDYIRINPFTDVIGIEFFTS